MLKVLIGDFFDSDAKTIVNAVNCDGVMGKGIAQEYKKRYSEMFEDYAERCHSGQVQPGVPYLYSDMFGASIVNFPTKQHWRFPSRLDYVIKGVDLFARRHKEWGVESVAFPALGCGNGGLKWEVVGPVMYQCLSALDIPVEIYAPQRMPGQQLTEAFLSCRTMHEKNSKI